MKNIYYLFICILVIGCKKESARRAKVSDVRKEIEYSHQVKEAIYYFNNNYQDTSVLNRERPKLIRRDSLSVDYKIQNDEKYLLISHEDNKLREIFYNSNTIFLSDLPFSKGSNRVSNSFEIPVLEDGTRRRFGFWIQLPNFRNFLMVYIEFTNCLGSNNMALSEFLSKAYLSYISEYQVII